MGASKKALDDATEALVELIDRRVEKILDERDAQYDAALREISQARGGTYGLNSLAPESGEDR